VAEIPRAARILAEKFCPGPITIIIPDGKGSTFGFRIPDHPFIIELLKASGRTFASTSANLSGQPAALNVDDALASIDGTPEVVVDWGPLPPDSKASTVVMVNADSSWKILREGLFHTMILNNILNAVK
jgi:L-threonylcarbamoyladenylate synthase